MSMLYRADDRSTADAPVPAPSVAGHNDGAGVYLTNEVFLYRVLEVVPSLAGEMVVLEDCYWLDVVHVPVSQLRARRLRVVMPAPVEG